MKSPDKIYKINVKANDVVSLKLKKPWQTPTMVILDSDHINLTKALTLVKESTWTSAGGFFQGSYLS